MYGALQENVLLFSEWVEYWVGWWSRGAAGYGAVIRGPGGDMSLGIIAGPRRCNWNHFALLKEKLSGNFYVNHDSSCLSFCIQTHTFIHIRFLFSSQQITSTVRLMSLLI